MHRFRFLAPIGVAFALAGCSGPYLGDAQLRQLGSALKNDAIGAMQASEYMDQGSAIASSGSGFTTQTSTTNTDGSVTTDIRFHFDAPRWDSAHHLR